MAEWLRRWASDPEVDGSNPGKLLVLLHIIPVCFRCASAMMLVAGGCSVVGDARVMMLVQHHPSFSFYLCDA